MRAPRGKLYDEIMRNPETARQMDELIRTGQEGVIRYGNTTYVVRRGRRYLTSPPEPLRETPRTDSETGNAGCNAG